MQKTNNKLNIKTNMETVNNEAVNIETFEQLTKLNFKDNRIDLDQLYKVVCDYEEKNKENRENEEDGMETFKRLGEIHVGSDVISDVTEDFDNIYSFFTKFDVNSKLVQNMPSAQRDKLFAIVKNVVAAYIHKFNNFEISVKLSETEAILLKDFFNQELKFDIKEIYTLIDMDEAYLIDLSTREDFKEGYEMLLSPYLIQGFSYFFQTQKVTGDHKFRANFKNLSDKFTQAINFITASTIVTNRVKEDTSTWITVLNEDLKEKSK